MPATDQYASLAEKLLEAQELERARIAADLHDSIGQNLTTIKFNLELWMARQPESPGSAPDLEPIKHQCEKIEETLAEIRHISRALHPAMLDKLGLVIALQSLCREYRTTHPNILLVERFDVNESQIPPPARLPVYRICQEALNNIAKHANADQITLGLYHRDHQLKLEITDDGIGISADTIPIQLSNGVGLCSIQQRTHQLDGYFSFHSKANSGTRLTIKLPIL